MDLIDFINKYWTILAGIASFIFAAAYTYFSNEQHEKDRHADVENFTERMKEQKENHDRQIAELQVKYTSVEVKLESLKDKIGDTINLMQQDIREIMTILKRDK